MPKIKINHDLKTQSKTVESQKKRKLLWSIVKWIIRIPYWIWTAIKFFDEGGF